MSRSGHSQPMTHYPERIEDLGAAPDSRPAALPEDNLEMDTPAVLLQIVQGTVSEIVSDTYVTRFTVDDETVWFRTSRAGRPPIAVGDSVAVVAGSIRPGSALIAIQIRRLRDARLFRPHKHTSMALRLAASALFRAHAAVGERGLSLTAAAVGPLASFGRGYLQTQVDIVTRHMAVVANRGQPAAANDAVAASSPSRGVPIGMQGAAPTTEAPWWHSELLEHTHDAIIIWEMEGAGILYWNHAAEQLYGYSREEARGKVTHDLLRTVTRKPVKDLESMLARYGVWIGELRHTTRDGRIVEVEARLSLMSQRSGKWLVLEVNRDITDRRYAEAAGAAREASLSSLHRER
jgi:PAS domain S-box-containing protein